MANRYQLWICPECDHYYGSTGMPDLSREKIVDGRPGDHKGEVIGYRDECPYCKSFQKKIVKKQLRTVEVVNLVSSG